MLDKASTIVAASGIQGLLHRAVAYAYRVGIRPRLPAAGLVHYANLPTGIIRKWGDRHVPRLWIPSEATDIPEYESALVSALQRFVRSGDQVVVVGGGVGITATVAALACAPGGRVRCFEGAAEGVAKVRGTAAQNGVADRLRVDHAVVARSISVYGTEPDRPVVAPSELPGCDVLELDCEGAEVDIITGMLIRPRVVLVETHGLYGAPTTLVEGLLRERGYRTEVLGLAEPRLGDYCEVHDIRVVVALRVDLEASGESQ
jgi:hypothetical protein